MVQNDRYQKKNRQRFWMCLVDGGNNPVHRHYTLREARIEAERLARLTSNDVFILDATDWVHVAPPEPPELVVLWKETLS